MGKGKGGQQESNQVQQIDPTVRKESSHLMNLFKVLAAATPQIYQGPTVAAFTPQQEAAFDSGRSAAAAFGMPTTGSYKDQLPAPTTAPSGASGYSAGALSQEQLDAADPAYKQMLNQFREGIGLQFEDKAPDNPKGRSGKKGGKK